MKKSDYDEMANEYHADTGYYADQILYRCDDTNFMEYDEFIDYCKRSMDPEDFEEESYSIFNLANKMGAILLTKDEEHYVIP